MLQVAKLHHLKILNLPHNCLSTIEGLKDLKLLTWLGLSGNRICTIDSLSQNIHLEHLDLSDNKITRISDISYLKNLKVFHSSIFLLDKTIDQVIRNIARWGSFDYFFVYVQTLLLHKNLIGALTSCEKFLPSTSLNTLTLNDNQLQVKLSVFYSWDWVLSVPSVFLRFS